VIDEYPLMIFERDNPIKICIIINERTRKYAPVVLTEAKQR